MVLFFKLGLSLPVYILVPPFRQISVYCRALATRHFFLW